MAACSKTTVGRFFSLPARGPCACRDRLVGYFFPLVVLAFSMLALAGCARYQIGNQTLFPGDVRTVHVPMFESSSFRRDLGERLTEAVVKEIERRAPYKVVSSVGADTVLSGRIVGEKKQLLLQTRNGDPRDLEVNLQVQVTWLDRRGNVVRECPPLPVPRECVAISAASQLVPEVGQSVATQQQKAINRLAQQIVNLMETPW